MTVVFKADATGKAAIYEGGDDLPFDNPQAYMSRVFFHSDLPMPYAVEDTKTDTFSIGQWPPQDTIPIDSRRFVINLFAHGKSYTPLVWGSWELVSLNTSGSASVSWLSAGSVVQAAGSVPIAIYSGRQHGRWLNLGVDATHVKAVGLDTWVPGLGNAGIAGCTLRYRVEVMSTALAGSSPSVATGRAVNITPTAADFGNGKFQSNREYVWRQAPTNYVLAAGRTLDVTGGPTNSGIGLRYNFNGYSREGTAGYNANLSAPGSSFVGSSQAVRI